MDDNRRLAAQVIDLFEDLLTEHSILIPDEDREGAEEKTAIFGSAYCTLEDGIVELMERAQGFDSYLAHEIVELFEDLLDQHGIIVPDDDRTGAEGESPIYGVTYGNLVDDVSRCLSGEVEIPQELAPHTEGICPVCYSEIEYGNFKLLDEGGIYEWECPNCGATGKEGYNLIFDGNHYDVRLADGTPFERKDGDSDGED